MKKVLVITGVTGAGKSSLALKCAELLDGEIISADSVAVYKELTIGSAKPSEEDQKQIAHHLIDIRSYHETYDVSQFQEDARKLIDEITERGKLPIVVGGSGLYINALLKDYRFEEESNLTPVDPKLSNEFLLEVIKKKDPLTGQSIHLNNRKRLERAYQVLTQTNRIPSKEKNANEQPLLYDAFIVFLNGERKDLYIRMDERVEKMFDKGLKREVEGLYRDDPNCFNYRSMSAIGYREFKEHFLGNVTEEEVKYNIKKNTRNFAKRQITWFKHQLEAEWVDIFSKEFPENIFDKIEKW